MSRTRDQRHDSLVSRTPCGTCPLVDYRLYYRTLQLCCLRLQHLSGPLVGSLL
jgi:hypothetical protein